MTYRRPGVTVTQAFVAAAPGLAALALPSVAVGPAYQIVNDDPVGTYSGAETTYSYASLRPGALVDVAELAEGELYPATKKPIAMRLKNVVLKIVGSTQTGAGNGTAFTDASTDIFENVLAGDRIVIVERTGVPVVAARTDGISSDSQRNRLSAPVAGTFADVKVGDSVVVTGGANTTLGTFTVSIKLSSQVLVLSADVNDGVGASTDVAYSITGTRSSANAGSYVVKTKTDNNTLVLTSPLADSPESPIQYTIERAIQDDVTLARDTTGFSADEGGMTLVSGIVVPVGAVDFPVLDGDVYASYRALRTDLYSEIRNYERISDIEAVFGVDQIVPANPLAYALSIMKQNTVTAVNGLALAADYATDEVLAYTKAMDVLSLEEMYAICPLTHSPAVHAAMKNHVEQLSLPGRKLERVVIVNSALNLTGLVQSEKTVSTALLGARTVVSTQVDGSGAVATPAVLNDATPDQFMNVQPGDSVTIMASTGVNPGVYTVISKASSNQITLSGNFISSGSPTAIQYYIQRQDGLGSDGVTFYDRNASFLSNGAAGGHYLEILGGTYKGRYSIASVTSEKELVLGEAILGVTSILTGASYKVTRDLSKTEQASNVSGYSSAFSSRRVIHTWPDTVMAPVGQSVVSLPGYFASATIAALTTGLPSQQGFTNLIVSGFIGFEHSSKYFSEEQLNVIADGGTLVFAQEGPEQPLFVRHQLTTDRSSIKFQEYSVTKNVDFIAKHMRDTFSGPIGKYNIEETTMDYLKTVAAAELKFLKDSTRLPFIGGNIRSGSLVKIEESAEQLDTVNMRFSLQIPIPLNYIDIVIEV